MASLEVVVVGLDELHLRAGEQLRQLRGGDGWGRLWLLCGSVDAGRQILRGAAEVCGGLAQVELVGFDDVARVLGGDRAGGVAGGVAGAGRGLSPVEDAVLSLRAMGQAGAGYFSSAMKLRGFLPAWVRARRDLLQANVDGALVRGGRGIGRRRMRRVRVCVGWLNRVGRRGWSIWGGCWSRRSRFAGSRVIGTCCSAGRRGVRGRWLRRCCRRACCVRACMS